MQLVNSQQLEKVTREMLMQTNSIKGVLFLVFFSFNSLTQTTVAEEQIPAHRAMFQQFKMGQRNVKSILAEKDIAWIGSSAGLVKYNVETDDYKFYNNHNGLRANGVFSINRLADNRLAIGTYGGGLAVLDESKDDWQLYNVPDGLGDPFVYDVLNASNGDLWIATWTGVNRVIGGKLDDKSAWQLYTVKSTAGGLPNDWVYGLAEGDNGVIWLATEGGLAQFKAGQWTNWNHSDGLGADYALVEEAKSQGRDPADFSRHHAKQKKEQGLFGVKTAYNPNYIVSMAVQSKSRVWVGTWGAGLSSFDGKKWLTLTENDGLPSNHIFMLHIIKDILWIGTSKGLVRYDLNTKAMQIYTSAHGLFADSVFSMDAQADGSLWIGGFGGVSHIISFPSVNPLPSTP